MGWLLIEGDGMRLTAVRVGAVCVCAWLHWLCVGDTVCLVRQPVTSFIVHEGVIAVVIGQVTVPSHQSPVAAGGKVRVAGADALRQSDTMLQCLTAGHCCTVYNSWSRQAA